MRRMLRMALSFADYQVLNARDRYRVFDGQRRTIDPPEHIITCRARVDDLHARSLLVLVVTF
jgi:hypothetical protein